MKVRYCMELVDELNVEDSVQVHVQSSGADRMLLIGAEGYGEKTAFDGGGHPVVIEFYKGELRLLVWGDINSEDPTHTISLEGARESARKREGFGEKYTKFMQSQDNPAGE